MSKIIVIGGGPSGVITSLISSNKHEVILLDGEDKILKKILLTGNGKCNYWNESIDTTKYNSNNKEYLSDIINPVLINDTYKYLESLGIYGTIKNGYYYPYSNSAASVREILVKALERSNVKVITNSKVNNIYKQNNMFYVETNNKTYTCDKLVLSTGSSAYPKTGSDGSGYLLSKKLGHNIIPIRSSLAPLILDEKFLKDWDGVRCNATISLYVDNNFIKEETGEIQLTSYGVSGICIFNLCSQASLALEQNKNVELKINFFNEVENLRNFLDERDKLLNNRTVEDLLESIFNYKLMFVILKKVGITKDTYYNDLNELEKNKLVDAINNFKVKVSNVESSKAQICAGGVSLSEINTKKLESNIVKDLYFTGELLDIDGLCGGYNLSLAFITGYIVGRSI